MSGRIDAWFLRQVYFTDAFRHFNIKTSEKLGMYRQEYSFAGPQSEENKAKQAQEWTYSEMRSAIANKNQQKRCDKDKQTMRRNMEKDRQKNKEKVREKEKQIDKEKNREKEKEKDEEKDREKNREKDRVKDKEKNREKRT